MSDTKSEADLEEDPDQEDNTDQLENDDPVTEVVIILPVDFEESAYSELIPHAKTKLDKLWKEELARGRPDRLSSAHAWKLQYLLEMRQPYPSDPYPSDLANCLQY